MNKKVILGLSGGVDSAVAAVLLQRQGYEVLGLYLDQGLPGGVQEAVSAAQALKVPLEVLDIRSELEEKVCAPFAAAYLRGETPNPCILCNPTVKFKALLDRADRFGGAYIATGHYARSREGKLYMGQSANDQSYMLCRLTREQLSRLLLPLGDYEKAQVRALAAEMGLEIAGKPDSMEICFIPDGDYAAFIEARGQVPPEGDFVDDRGTVLGRHRGIHRYTIGQRRGLGVALGQRMFVSDIRPQTDQVVLSSGEGLYVHHLLAERMNWQQEPPGEHFACRVRVRHSRAIHEGVAHVREEAVLVEFDEPVRAPTPGQSAVLYQEEMLLGGGFIVKS